MEEIFTSKITTSIISDNVTNNLKEQPPFRTITLTKKDAEGTSEEFLRSVLFDPIEKLPRANLTDSGRILNTYERFTAENYSPQRTDPLRISNNSSTSNKLVLEGYSNQRDDPLRISNKSGGFMVS